MERAGTLINRLLEQYQQNASADNLAATAQLLLAELQQATSGNGASKKKISVIMPQSLPHSIQLPSPEKIDHPEIQQPVLMQKEIIGVIKETEPDESFPHLRMADIPTLVYQNKGKPELNETINTNTESLNDKLKLNNTELGSVLQGSSVRDLRKAIGINDRYVFINELFRGDEAIYERSIKTINAFSILPEAEYWIKRELKLKFGWPEENTTVMHFDQLVKRRFS